MRASTSGASGTANGSFVMMTLERASPATSTPCQKLIVPSRTLGRARNRLSIVPRGICRPCTSSGNPASSQKPSSLSAAAWSIE